MSNRGVSGHGLGVRLSRHRRSVALALVLVAIGVACSAPNDTPGGSSSAPAPATRSPGERVTLTGNVHPLALPELDRGPVDGATRFDGVELVFKLTPEQQAARTALLADLQNPQSPRYHAWLTPQEYGARFGRTPGELAEVTAWLESQGLTVHEVSPTALRLRFGGTAAQLGAALRTELRRYEVGGEMHVALAKEPTLPASFADSVLAVRGLHDFNPKPAYRVAPAAPDYTNGSGAHFLTPGDWATIYDVAPLYAQTPAITGTGKTVVIAGQTSYPVADVATFRAFSGLPANAPTNFLVPGSGSATYVSANDEVEAELDVEWSGGVAPGASILFVYTGGGAGYNVFNSIEYAVENDLGPIISASYGACESQLTVAEANALEELAVTANFEGITLIASSGDDGAASCDYDVTIATHGFAVNFPASLPEVTALGGTEFNEGSSASTYWNATNAANNSSARSYIPETSWNDPPTGGNVIGASGGGASILFPKPIWQSGTGVPDDGARDLPDIAFTASAQHDGYIVYDSAQGGYIGVGGTSASAPSFAGVMSLVLQSMNSVGLGNVNPALYAMTVGHASAFHDVTTGSNVVPCKAGTTSCPATAPFQFGYEAGAGYDEVTGLGSLDVDNLVGGFLALQPTATELSAPATAPLGSDVALAATVLSVAHSPAMSGHVTYYDSFVSIGTQAIAPTTGATGDEEGTATLHTSTLALGTHSIRAAYTGDSSYLGSYTIAATTVVITAAVPDAGTPDAGTPDAGSPKDAGSGTPDAGPADAGSSSPDAGSGSSDAGSGSPDAGSGSPDAGSGSHDAGSSSQDAGSGSSDAGSGSHDAGSGSSDAGSSSHDAGSGSSDAGGSSHDAGSGSSDAGSSLHDAGGGASDAGSASSDSGAGDGGIIVTGSDGGAPDAGEDAGTVANEDSGIANEDAGTSPSGPDAAVGDDAGVATNEDAGTSAPGQDASTSAANDAGGASSGGTVGAPSGCGCTVVGADDSRTETGALGGMLFGLAAFARRRRARRG